MGFRFQKRLKILPGVSLNFSKSGVSTSVGPRGAKVTLGHGKIRETVGIPGTGISYTTTSSLSSPHTDEEQSLPVPVAAPEVPSEVESGWVIAGRIAGKVLYWVTIGLIVAVGAAVAFMLAIVFSSGKRHR